MGREEGGSREAEGMHGDGETVRSLDAREAQQRCGRAPERS